NVRAALRSEEVVERIVRTAELVRDDLVEELPAEVERRRERVVAVATAADAVARLEHDGPEAERSEHVPRPETADPGADDDGVVVGRRTSPSTAPTAASRRQPRRGSSRQLEEPSSRERALEIDLRHSSFLRFRPSWLLRARAAPSATGAAGLACCLPGTRGPRGALRRWRGQ